MSQTFSEGFGLNKNQSELDFVDIFLEQDNLLFIDPFAIALCQNPFSRFCYQAIENFFSQLRNFVISNDHANLKTLLKPLSEPDETRFGLSKKGYEGSGLGEFLVKIFTEAIPIKTGHITSLEQCELLINDLGQDILSDLATNIIRGSLIEYTQQQCLLHEIKAKEFLIGATFCTDEKKWIPSQKVHLPAWKGIPLLLVPRLFSSLEFTYNSKNFYNFAHRSMQGFHKSSRFEKEAASFSSRKEFLYKIAQEEPDLFTAYLDQAPSLGGVNLNGYVESDKAIVAKKLIESLQSIQCGLEYSEPYCLLMTGLIEFIFFPSLSYPKKEMKSDDENFRYRISMESSFPLPHFPETVFFEFKNEKGKEADLAFRNIEEIFKKKDSAKIIFKCFRSIPNRPSYIEKCLDIFRRSGKKIVPIDDTVLIELLELPERWKKDRLSKLIAEIS